jgi:predicted O-methyltransferase YrrM
MTMTALDSWLAQRYWPEDDLLRALRADLHERGPTIQISPEAGQLLGVLIGATGARRVLEVGTLFGYSAVWMARALPPDGHIDTIELEPLHADAAEHWLREAGVAERVRVHRGRAADVLDTLPGPYDLVFIDADKAGYAAYARAGIERLRPGGLLVADNVLWHGAIADPDDRSPQAEGIRALHDVIGGDAGLRSTVVPVGDGLSLSVKSPES